MEELMVKQFFIYNILGSLTVARAFGDFFLKHNSIISVIPEISIYNRPL